MKKSLFVHRIYKLVLVMGVTMSIVAGLVAMLRGHWVAGIVLIGFCPNFLWLISLLIIALAELTDCIVLTKLYLERLTAKLNHLCTDECSNPPKAVDRVITNNKDEHCTGSIKYGNSKPECDATESAGNQERDMVEAYSKKYLQGKN